jgi:hypothetical protein
MKYFPLLLQEKIYKLNDSSMHMRVHTHKMKSVLSFRNDLPLK